ncbi:MAG: hypothetical protein WCA20_12845 [Candidatus Sulfotelmatobacter sp.]
MLKPEPEGGSTALAPALPGSVTYGRTVDEAREMARDAISGYMASLRKPNDPVPTDDNTLVASQDLEYSRQEITGPVPSNWQSYPPSNHAKSSVSGAKRACSGSHFGPPLHLLPSILSPPRCGP